MNLPELQKIINEAPGSDIDVPFFEELKTALNGLLDRAGTNAALPVYADNADALSNNAPVGSLYALPTGAVMTVLEGTP